MKPGDMLTLSTGGGTDYGCMIESVGVDCVTLRLCYEQPADCEPTVTVRLFQGMPKGDKLEDVVQKCTELGVREITPVLTRRSVSRPEGRAAEKKCARYRRIALEAAQQSGRGIVPDISEITDLKSALATDDSELKILFYEGGGDCLKNIVPPGIGSVSVYIGPEGGFDHSEVDMLINRRSC